MITPDDIKARILDYLSGTIIGRELVRYIDDAVGNDDVYEYSAYLQYVVLKYQDMLAHYVENPLDRLEHSSFFGPDKLKLILTEMLNELNKSS